MTSEISILVEWRSVLTCVGSVDCESIALRMGRYLIIENPWPQQTEQAGA